MRCLNVRITQNKFETLKLWPNTTTQYIFRGGQKPFFEAVFRSAFELVLCWWRLIEVVFRPPPKIGQKSKKKKEKTHRTHHRLTEPIGIAAARSVVPAAGSASRKRISSAHCRGRSHWRSSSGRHRAAPPPPPRTQPDEDEEVEVRPRAVPPLPASPCAPPCSAPQPLPASWKREAIEERELGRLLDGSCFGLEKKKTKRSAWTR